MLMYFKTWKTMFRIEMLMDDDNVWSCVAMVSREAVDETFAQYASMVGEDRVRTVHTVDGENVGIDSTSLRREQDKDYEACLLQDQEQERLKAMEERRNARKKKTRRGGTTKKSTRARRVAAAPVAVLRFSKNRRLTRSAAKRLNYK